MKKLVFLVFTVFIVFYSNNVYAAMEDYCAAPSYVIQNIPPNVMIILDNSGSMYNFAYFDGFSTTSIADDNMCTDSANPCTGFATPGAYPTFKFYGYYNPDYWYTYASGRFTAIAPKTGSGITNERAKAAAEWDGNFLNWAAMRRVDVARKVLTGGASTGTGLNTRLLGARPDGTSRGTFKQIANIQNYIDDSIASGTRCIVSDTGGAATATFDIMTGNCTSAVAAGGSNIGVDVNVALPTQTAAQVQVQGVIQEVGTRVRLGLTFYNTDTGGRVARDIRGSNCGGNSLPCVVNDINSTNPSTWTPLGETLWTVTGYFAQQASISGGPGPRYAAGNFTINNNNDPYNFGTGGQPIYPTCARSYVILITDGEPCQDGNLPNPSIEQYASGKSIYDCSGTNCPAAGPFPAQTIPACPDNVAGVEDVALYAHTTDLRNSPTLGSNNISGTQNLTLYMVSAFGRGSTLLRYAAINGGFEDSNANNQPDLQSEWDNNSDNEPDTYYEADEGYSLETALKSLFSKLLSRSSSGTAVSVLASGEGSGANLIQGIFYPRRKIGNDVIGWTGSLQNLWYYMDPFFVNANIREDTTADKRLNLTNDYITQFYFDSTSTVLKTRLRRFSDSDGDGDADTQLTALDFEAVKGLWESGYELWKRDLTANPRKLYTTINGLSFLTNDFASGNASTLEPYLQAANSTEAEYIIRYIHGYDTRCSACSAPNGLVTVDTDDDGTNDYLGVDINPNDGVDDYRSRYVKMYNDVTAQTEKRIWKLGDILNSTPRIASWLRINTYDYDVPKYSDNSYKQYLGTVGYESRGMVFTGGNDGMLHAFKLGNYELPGYNWTGAAPSSTEKAAITGSNLGKEMWGFIPKNALPYLKYIADPEYCHIYTVDLTPYLVDVSIGGNPGDVRPADGSSWRTVLIGGMRTGGASKGTTAPCSNISGSSIGKDCVNTPVDVGGESIGYSSYFALDVTDPENPVFLWEFSHPELGFATSGPAVIRVGPGNQNGEWFVVFGSGPTGPISTLDTQFMGRSDQNLKFFVLNLETGSLLQTIDTGIQYAFAGSMVNSTVDPNVDYSDDALYVGYTNIDTNDGNGNSTNPYKWTQGGIGRIVTSESSPAVTPWVWRPLMTNIGPVTSTIARMQNKNTKAQWLFFGTGRHFYATGNIVDGVDDVPNRRRIFGIKEPCLTSSGPYGSLNPACTNTVSAASLLDVTAIPGNTAVDNEGWFIYMDISGNYTYSECQSYDSYGNCTSQSNVTRAYGAERVITNSVASTTGCVFYTSYKPYNDVCALGGKTFMWAVKYNTGGDPTSCLQGKILAQVSTGSIEEINLKDAFVNRKSVVPIEGVPSQDEPPLLTTPQPVRRPMHIKER
ncbi:MAG: PilC/PilY family type IV pilus protein [Nitrospirota bacterium]